MAKIRPVADLFAGTQESQHVLSLKDRISELESELEELKQSGSVSPEEELAKRLENEGGVHKLPIEKLLLDPNQPRNIFPQHVIEERAESLRREGQLVPIIVIPLEDGNYRIFEGHIRRLAAPIAGLTHLNAVFRDDADPSALFDQQLTTSIQSQSLHSLDLALGLIRLIEYRSPEVSGSKVPSLLNAAIHKLRKSGQASELERLQSVPVEHQQNWLRTTDLSDEERIVVGTILSKTLHPISINSNAFPLLKLPPELQDAMRAGLEPSKAREIAKITAARLKQSEQSAIALRRKLAESTLAEKWSLSELKGKLQEVLPESSGGMTPLQQAIKIAQSLIPPEIDPKTDFEELTTLRQNLQQQIQKIDQMLNASE